MERGLEVSGETKTLSASTLSKVWRPAVGENLLLQQASESLHEEAWVGRGAIDGGLMSLLPEQSLHRRQQTFRKDPIRSNLNNFIQCRRKRGKNFAFFFL